MNLMQAWKLWGIWSTIAADEKKETTMNPQGAVTPGWKTSEFWLHLAAQIPTVAAVFLGAANPVVLALTAACALGSAIYTVSRSQVKVAAITAGAQAAADALAKTTAPAADATKA